MFESSWVRLAPAEQHTLAALTVFRGGFTVQAAERVAGPLAPLVEKSLVQRDGERFLLHEVVRQFSGEKLDDPAPAPQDHGACFAAWTEAQTQSEEPPWFARLAGGMENVRGLAVGLRISRYGCADGHGRFPQALSGRAGPPRRGSGAVPTGAGRVRYAPQDAAGLASDPTAAI